jgi:polyhydroxyalkanoate synthesis regulator phasin
MNNVEEIVAVAVELGAITDESALEPSQPAPQQMREEFQFRVWQKPTPEQESRSMAEFLVAKAKRQPNELARLASALAVQCDEGRISTSDKQWAHDELLGEMPGFLNGLAASDRMEVVKSFVTTGIITEEHGRAIAFGIGREARQQSERETQEELRKAELAERKSAEQAAENARANATSAALWESYSEAIEEAPQTNQTESCT